jgi:glutamyl-tRNA synthetase
LRQSASYFALAASLAKATAVPDIVSALDALDDHLAYRTFLIGHSITGADWMVWGALKGPSVRSPFYPRARSRAPQAT